MNSAPWIIGVGVGIFALLAGIAHSLERIARLLTEIRGEMQARRDS